MNTNPNRVFRGTPAGGQFATKDNDESAVGLGGLSIDEPDVGAWLDRNNLPLPAHAVNTMTQAINAHGIPITDILLADVYREVHEGEYGFTHEVREKFHEALTLLHNNDRADLAEAIRTVSGVEPASQPSSPRESGIHGLRNSRDPEVQAGGVFDMVRTDDGTVFNRADGARWVHDAQAVRIQANRPLSAAESEQIGDLTKYALAASVHGEVLGDPEMDSIYSFTLGYDFTKGSQERAHVFESTLNDIVRHGSPKLKTDRKGPIGSQTVPGLGDETLKFEIYYDSTN
jgi:hypothetical protein